MARSTTNNLLIYYITAEMKVAVLEEYDMNQWVQFGKWDIVTRWFLWAPVMEYGVADKSPIFPSLSDGKLLHWRLMTSCRAILRVCSLFASFHRCCRCYGMRFLRGRVEVVDSLATTPYYPSGYFQTCMSVSNGTCACLRHFRRDRDWRTSPSPLEKAADWSSCDLRLKSSKVKNWNVI